MVAQSTTLIGIPACGDRTTLADGGGYPATPYRTCAGEVKSWDGLDEQRLCWDRVEHAEGQHVSSFGLTLVPSVPQERA